MLVRCPTVLQVDASRPLNVRSEIEVERDVDLINGKQQPFYFEKENLPYEMIQQVLRENDRETLGKFFTGPDARYRGRIRQWCGRWRRSLPWRCSQGTSCTSPAGRRRKKCVINIAKAGLFSSDRTIAEYNKDIWHLGE